MVPRTVLGITLWGYDTECGNGQHHHVFEVQLLSLYWIRFSGAFLPQHGYLS